MDFPTLRERLTQFDPIFLPDIQERKLRIVEKTGRWAGDVLSADLMNQEKVASQILDICDKNEAGRPISFDFFIHLKYESVLIRDIDRCLVALVALFQSYKANIRIIIHSKYSEGSWHGVQTLIKSFYSAMNQTNGAGFRLVAPFGEFNESEMATLFDLGVRIRFAAGWGIGGPSDGVYPINANALRAFSEFGFQAVINWYTHDGNLLAFEEQIENLMAANCNSGFSLPLVSQNPYYRFEPNFPSLPDMLEYCDLLARMYKQYPYYDDTFSPLSDLAVLVKNGGWNTKLSVPRTINMMIDEDGGATVYRQSPAMAIHWSTLDNILKTPLANLKEGFFEFINNIWQWENVPYCKECRWRYICGGLDPLKDHNPQSKDLDAMCGHRKLFLEHFMIMRAPDFELSGD
jgi:hypothetical protein